MFILLAQTYHAVMHQVMEGAALANIYILRCAKRIMVEGRRRETPNAG